MKILYTAEATATGGREGHVRSSDGAFEANLSVPKEMGGAGGLGTNPEQLFAAGYAACFQSALMVAARRQHVDASKSTVTGKVGIGPTAGGTFGLEVELHIQLPEVERSVGEQLVTMAHAVCPYSNATRGNIEVKLFLDEETVGGD
jgi:Ohr subfamily peroxiredoxin